MNRTKIIMKATCICIFVFLLQGALTLLRTKVFIEFYGSEVNGVIELTHQIFSYIILLESGLGSAYLFKMYMPMTKSEYNKVNGLYKGLTNSLKKIMQ